MPAGSVPVAAYVYGPVPPLVVKVCENAAAYGALSVVDAGVIASVGAATVSVKPWPTVNGPLPELLSVAETLREKLPACVGVPERVTVFAVVPVIDTPAGR